MGFDLDDSLDLLERTPAVLESLLRNLPAEWLSSDEGPGTWTPVDVVGHLLHGDFVDWVPRVEHTLRHGTDVPWDSFDPDGADEVVAGRGFDQVLDAFATKRATNIARMRELDLTEADLDRTAIHFTFGEVTMRQHLATWAAHDLDHLRQITRALALRHAEAIGPWHRFLTIMD